MTIAGEGANPRKHHFLKVAEKLNLNTVEANKIIEEVQESTVNCAKHAKNAAVPKNIQTRLGKIFENISL